MKISMIAAIGKNRELGYGNQLIWKIPRDLERFKKITSGHPIIMGRKTYQSINRLLPNRTNIIITRDPKYEVDGALVVNSIEEAIKIGKKIHNTKYLIHDTENEVFIIGGAQIYALGMPYANKLYLTKIDAENPNADAFFPDYSKFKKVVFLEKHNDDGLEFEFLDLEK